MPKTKSKTTTAEAPVLVPPEVPADPPARLDDGTPAAAADTASPDTPEPDTAATAGLLGQADVKRFLAAREDRIRDLLLTLARDEQISPGDLYFLTSALGTELDNRLDHARKIVAADLAVSDAEKVLAQHAADTEKLAEACRVAKITADSVNKWTWNDDAVPRLEYGVVMAVRERAAGDLSRAGYAARNHENQLLVLQARLRDAKAARASL
jgi:hypothetical protein